MDIGTPPDDIGDEKPEWVRDRAEELDVQPAVVWDFLEDEARGVATVDEYRTRLAKLFDAHLGRPMLSDHYRVQIYDGEEGRYDYVMGTHYARDVDDAVREVIRTVADEQRLVVELDGTTGIAVRFDEPVPSADACLAADICRRAFDTTLGGLDDEVYEVVDQDTRHSWTTVD
ncbi:hypothetical protein [Haloarchaeobius salinus]|uniref:hypothetical protein n=1 Tax=Haloarchaeobius salinus TaxID=1198298 RepID=UPI00210C10CD|nr:hypothetical protein [Haloarchaeobius salinus]